MFPDLPKRVKRELGDGKPHEEWWSTKRIKGGRFELMKWIKEDAQNIDTGSREKPTSNIYDFPQARVIAAEIRRERMRLQNTKGGSELLEPRDILRQIADGLEQNAIYLEEFNDPAEVITHLIDTVAYLRDWVDG